MGRSVAVLRGVCAVAAIAAALVFPVPASALSSPEIFYAEGDVSGFEGTPPQSLWQPLSGASIATLSPVIGVRLQDSQSGGSSHPFQIDALSVPDGRPSQDPSYWGGSCDFADGQIGQIGQLQQLQYEGPGVYTIRVTAFNQSEASSTHCATGGVSQTVSFRIDGRPALRFTAPQLLAGGSSTDSRGQEVGLIETLPPLASSQQTVCVLDARVAGDGSLSGKQSFEGESGAVSQGAFPQPGNWTCVARAFAGVSHPPPGDSDPKRATAWSAPVTAFFRTDISVRSLRIADGKAPSFVLAGKVNRAAAGGFLKLRLTRAPGCSRAVTNELTRARVRSDGSYRIVMRLAVSRRSQGKLDGALWRATLTYSGNRLVRSATHLGVVYPGRSVAFAPGIGYLRTSLERRLKLYAGGRCTVFA